MTLAWIDWLIIGLFTLITLGIGFYFRQQAGKDISQFFLGGRNLPWWIVGTSMVATTFAADTPLAVTGFVAENGVSGNWVWWNMLAGGMLTTFFFAKYWRRAGVLTDVELIEMRYSGPEAKVLRVFRSVYFGVFMNAIIIAWVNKALERLLVIFFEIPEAQAIWYVGLAMVLVALYTSLSGILGVAYTDVLQFCLAMCGSIALAVLVVNSEEIGGIAALQERLPAGSLQVLPQIGGEADTANMLTIGLGAFLARIGVQWWASWYPGGEPGGGGYIAQRMMSAKDERHAVYSTLFFQIAHYCLRPWPWIIVALCAVVLYPQLLAPEAAEGSAELGYVMAMKQFLPPGLKGLMLAAFFAAYMSTVSTQLNWGSSYLVNDFVKRLLLTDLSEKQYVLSARVTTVVLMIVAFIVSFYVTSVKGAWEFLMECGAGLGLVFILRWYWWRINAWSEIAATIAPFVFYSIAHFGLDMAFPDSFMLTVGGTTAIWLLVTFVTPPSKAATLQAFYDKVRPEGAWGPFQPPGSAGWLRLGLLGIVWIASVLFAYSFLFLLGQLIFGDYEAFALSLGVALVCLALMLILLRKVRLFDEPS